MNSLKILVVGGFVYHMYEGAFFDKFLELGYSTEKFAISKYLTFNSPNFFLRNYYKAQYKFNLGPSIVVLNNKLIKKVKEVSPDIVFVYRGKHILPRTLIKIKEACPNVKCFNYNNDDAFSSKYPRFFWGLYRKSIKYYDHVFCYRSKNIVDLKKLNYNNTSLLLPYYIKEKNFKEQNCYYNRTYQVVFIGHYEDDGRDEYIKSLIEVGYKVGLFGTGWEKSPHYKFFINNFGAIKRLNGDSYNATLNDAKIALVFMSKLNSDEYTRRCFEIPSTGAVMVSERTPSLMNLFKEDEEIIFFETKEDLLYKLKKLFKDEKILEDLSINASNRLVQDKHELTDRLNAVIDKYYQIKKK